MLLIWFQETVSRQLNFQLLSYGECMHKTYLYLSCIKAGSDAHIPVSCHSRIKRNVNRSSWLNAAWFSLHSKNLLLVSLGILTGIRNMHQSTKVQLITPCKKLEYWAAGQVTRGTASSSLLPHAYLLPSSQPAPAVGLSQCCEQVSSSCLYPPIISNRKSVGKLLIRKGSWATTRPLPCRGTECI